MLSRARRTAIHSPVRESHNQTLHLNCHVLGHRMMEMMGLHTHHSEATPAACPQSPSHVQSSSPNNKNLSPGEDHGTSRTSDTAPPARTADRTARRSPAPCPEAAAPAGGPAVS